ncbi:sorting and assembly machinery component 50 [Anaeramoeba flamelloides]|uniref:Sorting and assembly machinery component 50 n=1 Tax=Anaeramoeba flamelloides TaxID=1746091 RepID=A0ABQ8YYL5_9EUKA|nr:sorting and assembly machinery component 50 [Anaeramoeba flamelloides]
MEKILAISRKQDQFLQKQLRVTLTEIKGVEKTKKELLLGHLNKFKEPNNLEELLITSDEFLNYLKTLNIFESAQIEYDLAKQYVGFKKQNSSVKILLKEHSSLPRFKTFLGPFSIGGLLSTVNLSGKAERVDLFANLGAPITNLYLGFTKPLLSHKFLTLDGLHLDAYKSDYSIPNRSENLVRKGIKLTFSTPFVRSYYHQSHFKTTKPGTHSLTYNLESRKISNKTINKGFLNLEVELDSKKDGNDYNGKNQKENNPENLKASVMYSYRFDNRDRSVFPSKGFHFDFSNEFAAIYQSESFFKSKLKFGLHLPIFKKLSISLKGNSGVVTSTSFPLTSRNVSIFERFYPKYQKNLPELKQYLFGEKNIHKKNLNNYKLGKGNANKKPESESKSEFESESESEQGHESNIEDENEFEFQTQIENERTNNPQTLVNQNYLDSYGADVYGNLTAAINLKIPFPTESNFTFGASAFIRSQVFGLTDLLNHTFKDNIYQMVKRHKTEMGLGFSTCCEFKRFDLNWTVPLAKPNKKLLKQLKFSLEMDIDYDL